MGFKVKTKDGVSNINTVSLISTLGSAYDIKEFTTWEWAKEGWEASLPKGIGRTEGVEIVDSDRLSVQLLSAIGMQRYLAYLTKRIRAVRKELEERHNRKSKLLSESLKRSTTIRVSR